jgi:hypothetical protein
MLRAVASVASLMRANNSGKVVSSALANAARYASTGADPTRANAAEVSLVASGVATTPRRAVNALTSSMRRSVSACRAATRSRRMRSASGSASQTSSQWSKCTRTA